MQINIQIDDQLKKEVDPILESMGINMTTAVTMFLKQVVRTNSIPFPVTADPFYSHENQQYLSSVVNEIDKGTAEFIDHDLIEV